MLALPILNVRLQACPEAWQQMAPTAAGRHCAHCDREVVDFTRATAAELAAARAAAPNGRLCGRFRQSQLAAPPPPRLRPKLRRFLVALVLVCGLGLTSREAWAQVRAGAKTVNAPRNIQPPLPAKDQSYDLPAQQVAAEEEELIGKVYVYAEQMPVYPGGTEAMLRFIAQHTRYPKGATQAGKVFVNFLVMATGQVRNAHVQKGLGPAFDAEAIRIIQSMPRWKPGRQNNRPVDVSYTVPVTFPPSNAVPPAGRKSKFSFLLIPSLCLLLSGAAFFPTFRGQDQSL